MASWRTEIPTKLGVTVLLACLASAAIASEPRRIATDDIIQVTVKETADPHAKPEFHLPPSMAPRMENGVTVYRVAARIVDVLPDGFLRLEARVAVSHDMHPWDYSLTGKIRREDISPDRTASSERIADLCISKVRPAKQPGLSSRSWFSPFFELAELFRGERAAEKPE